MSDLPLPTTPKQLLGRLDALGISYQLHHHKPIFTVEEGWHLKESIPGTHCRNLFVRDKKHKMFLITAANETQIDLKKLSNLLNCGRLSFGSPGRLWTYLGIQPGSVNPFCIANDKNHEVTLILDHTMMRSDIINVHPMDNAMTIGLAPGDLLKFLTDIGHPYEIHDLSPAAPGP